MNRQDACSTKDKFYCGTGILPVADACSTKDKFYRGTGILPVADACSTKDKFYCGTGILPVADNGARYRLKPTVEFDVKSYTLSPTNIT
ncbi:hypothetical protein [Microcoleus sp. D2_18a_B4]|uniref:hypothetical protein n=1 Tax=Microcoleus sp. D2_18a_B4 TaxID=3055329 RepID=UPI002FD2E63E